MILTRTALRVSDLPEVRGRSGWPWDEDSGPAEWAVPLPRISIVTTSFNQAAFLEETIRSVLLQGYPELEYIVIDGGSTDGSVDILRKYEPWISYWISEKDRGQSHAINKGFARATGDLLTFTSSDDIYLPGAFRAVARRWPLPGYGVVVGGFRYIDGERMRSESIPARLPGDGPIDLVITPPGAWRLHQVSSLYVREELDKVGRSVREDLIYNMDRELLYRVCAGAKVLLVPETLGAFRWHPDGKSITNLFRSDMEIANLHLSYKYSRRRENRLRRAVSNQRRAKGYVRYAGRSGSRLRALRSLTVAAYYQPDLLVRREFFLAGTQAILPKSWFTLLRTTWRRLKY